MVQDFVDCCIKLRPASNALHVDFFDVLTVGMEFVRIQDEVTREGNVNVPNALHKFNWNFYKLGKKSWILECSKIEIRIDFLVVK